MRAEYRHKLEKLSQRRDELYRAMREDLDRAVQERPRADRRGDPRSPARRRRRATAQEAAHARERLVSLAERQREAEEAAGLVADPARAAASRSTGTARARATR